MCYAGRGCGGHCVESWRSARRRVSWRRPAGRSSRPQAMRDPPAGVCDCVTLEWPLLPQQQGCEARRASGDTSTVYVAVKECTISNAARRVRSTTRSGAALPCILGNTPMFEAQPAGEQQWPSVCVDGVKVNGRCVSCERSVRVSGTRSSNVLHRTERPAPQCMCDCVDVWGHGGGTNIIYPPLPPPCMREASPTPPQRCRACVD